MEICAIHVICLDSCPIRNKCCWGWEVEYERHSEVSRSCTSLLKYSRGPKSMKELHVDDKRGLQEWVEIITINLT
jgi:hypothetical protein